MTDRALCAICAVDAPRPVICLRCEQRLRRDLDTVGKLRSEIAGFLRPVRGRGGKAPGKPGSKPPARLDVIAATDVRTSRIPPDPKTGKPNPDDVVNVDACLLAWGRMTCEERRLAHPMRDALDVVRVLNISYEWWTRHPAVDEFSREIHMCAMALRRFVGDMADPAIGRCNASRDDGTDCGGPLRLGYDERPAAIDTIAAPTHIVCGWCGDAWMLRADVLLAMLRVVKPKAFPVPRSWAAEVTGVDPATLRQWVRRGHVKTYSDEQVNLVDVLVRVSDTHKPG